MGEGLIEAMVQRLMKAEAEAKEYAIRRAFADTPIFLETVLATRFFPPTGRTWGAAWAKV